MVVERGCGRTILSGGEACLIRALPLFYAGFALVLTLALPLLPMLTALLHLYQLYVEDEC